MPELDEVIERYEALWNGPDGDVRREAICEPWAEQFIE